MLFAPHSAVFLSCEGTNHQLKRAGSIGREEDASVVLLVGEKEESLIINLGELALRV
jgi:hypothetical protein